MSNERHTDANDKKIRRLDIATHWQLMWWRFRKHKMALVSVAILVLFYAVGIFCELVAPYDPEQYFVKYKLAPPSKIYIRDPEGNFHWPFVYSIVRERDPETMRNIYTEDTETRYPIRLFVRGTEYEMWGLFTTDLHLFGLPVSQEEQGIFLLGADRLGRDMFSRLCY